MISDQGWMQWVLNFSIATLYLFLLLFVVEAAVEAFFQGTSVFWDKTKSSNARKFLKYLAALGACFMVVNAINFDFFMWMRGIVDMNHATENGRVLTAFAMSGGSSALHRRGLTLFHVIKDFKRAADEATGG